MILYNNMNKSLRLKIVIRLLLLLAVLFFAFPLVWMIMTAIKTRIDFFAWPPKFIFLPTLDNFIKVFQSSDFVKAYINSLIVSAMTVIIGMLLGVPAAYGLSRFNFKRRKDLAFWILSAKFAPPVIVLIPFYIIYSRLHLSDTYTGMVLIYLIINLPMVIWIMYGFFKEVPMDIEEAATVDGAKPFYIFTKIVLSMVAPGIVTTAILCLIFTWNELMFGMILTNVNTRLLPLAIYNNISYEQIAWGTMCASGMMAVIPVSIFTIIIQKHLVSGLTFGAIKQ